MQPIIKLKKGIPIRYIPVLLHIIKHTQVIEIINGVLLSINYSCRDFLRGM